ncbi:MAG: FapA family protein [Desulfobacterales bacterium]|nr:FapA family protein [Desulfobacterales bacterium]
MVEDQSKFELRITDDEMAVMLDCTISEANPNEIVPRIKQELEAAGVTPVPREEELETLLRWSIKSGTTCISEMPIVEGIPPVPPIDGTIKWAGDFFDKGSMVDEKSANEDHILQAVRPGPVVEKGQLLACVTLPKEGQEGCDVFGKPIAVRQPKSAEIRPGLNVKVQKEKDRVEYFATIRGRVKWVSGALVVNREKTISGNVGIANGHLDCPGSLVIEGDVMAGAEITTGDTIEIKGALEAAIIHAGGNLIVGKGIAGREDRRIKVEGGIKATHILDGHIEAWGDIVVKNEIIQSTLKTQGAVVIPDGRVVGGSVTALGGIDVGEAGSDGHVNTELVVAEDYSLPAKIAPKEEELVILQAKVERIHELLDPMMVKQKELSLHERETAAKRLLKAEEAEAAVEKVKAEIQKIEADSRARAKPHILIRRLLYPGTTLCIAGNKVRTNKAVTGPLEAVLSGENVVLRRVAQEVSHAIPKKWNNENSCVASREIGQNPEMKAEYINLFIESVQNLFLSMLGCKANPGKAGLADGVGNPGDIITALIGLSGPVRGNVALTFPVETVLAIVNRMLGSKTLVVNDIVADGVAELVNMVAGGAKKKLSSADGPPVDLGLPTVLSGNGYVVQYPSKSIWFEVPFTSDLGTFTLQVTFELQKRAHSTST